MTLGFCGTSGRSWRSPFGVPKIQSPESEPDIQSWDEIWTDLEELTAPCRSSVCCPDLSALHHLSVARC